MFKASLCTGPFGLAGKTVLNKPRQSAFTCTRLHTTNPVFNHNIRQAIDKYRVNSFHNHIRSPNSCLRISSLVSSTAQQKISTRIVTSDTPISTFDLNFSEEGLIKATKKLVDKTNAYDRMMYDQFFTLNLKPLEQCLISVSDQIVKMRILDIGAGTGLITKAILKHTKPQEMYLFESDLRIKITPPDHYESMHFINNSFLYHQLQNTGLPTGIIAHPPLSRLNALIHFIEKQQIQSVILIVPADKLRKFSTEYKVVGTLNNADIYPNSASEGHVSLIIQRGFEPEKQVLAYDSIEIGRNRLNVREVLMHAKKMTQLSPGIQQQAADLLGGEKFDTIQDVIATLNRKENNQKGVEFKRNIELSPQELELFYEHNRHKLPQSEIENLKVAITENKFSGLSLSILSHLQKHDRVVLGQRYLMDRYMENGSIKQKELLNIPSDSWSWRLNEFWISAAALLNKKVNIYCDQIPEVMDLIHQQAKVLDKQLTSKIIPLWHVEFDRPTLLAREIHLLSHLNYKFEVSHDTTNSTHMIEALPAGK